GGESFCLIRILWRRHWHWPAFACLLISCVPGRITGDGFPLRQVYRLRRSLSICCRRSRRTRQHFSRSIRKERLFFLNKRCTWPPCWVSFFFTGFNTWRRNRSPQRENRAASFSFSRSWPLACTAVSSPIF